MNSANKTLNPGRNDMNKIQSTDVSEDYMYLLGYTRTPLDDDIYSPKLAYSMHLALSEDGKS